MMVSKAVEQETTTGYLLVPWMTLNRPRFMSQNFSIKYLEYGIIVYGMKWKQRWAVARSTERINLYLKLYFVFKITFESIKFKVCLLLLFFICFCFSILKLIFKM